MECDKTRIRLDLFIQFEDDSCEAHFNDESLLLLSACGTQFQHVVPPGIWANTETSTIPSSAFGSHVVTQRTAFTISMFRQKVRTTLNLRNQLAERVFVNEQFLDEKDLVKSGRCLREIRFPTGAEQMHVERNADGVWQMTSFDDFAQMTLRSDGNVITFRYLVRLDDEKLRSNASSSADSGSEHASEKRYARVEQRFTADLCPRWTKPAVDLLLRIVAARSGSSKSDGKETSQRCGVEEVTDDVVLRLPTSLRSVCTRPHLHTESFVNEAEEYSESMELKHSFSFESRLSRRQSKVKAVVRGGPEDEEDNTVYLVSERAVELLLSDTSYLRSKTRAGLFFTHYVAREACSTDEKTFETRVYSTDAAPVLHRSTTMVSKVLNLGDVLRFARHLCDLLQPAFSVSPQRHVAFRSDSPCWHESSAMEMESPDHSASGKERKQHEAKSSRTHADDNVLERFAVDGLLRSVTLTNDGKVRAVFDDRTLLETRLPLQPLRRHWSAAQLCDSDEPGCAENLAWRQLERFYAALQSSSSSSRDEQVAKPGCFRLLLRNGTEWRFDTARPCAADPAYLVYVTVGSAVCEWLAILPRCNRPDFADFLEERLDCCNVQLEEPVRKADNVSELARQLEEARNAKQRASVTCELNKIERFVYRVANDGVLQLASTKVATSNSSDAGLRLTAVESGRSRNQVAEDPCNVEEVLANLRNFLNTC